MMDKEERLKEGQMRYGSRQNDAPQKCAGCGANIPDGEGSYRHDKPYCDKCTNPGMHKKD